MNIDLKCLGIGKGASYVIKGQPSSSFAIRVNNEPKLLVDCGAGIGLSCLQNLNGVIPDKIYISHNHLDHTGDLPILLQVICEQTGKKPKIFGNSTVLDIVKQHRLHELNLDNLKPEDFADWIVADKNGVIQLDEGLSLQLFRTIHSYICYGFTLTENNRLLLGYTADSGFDEAIYQTVTQAPIAIVDGRDTGNADHASLEQVEAFARTVPHCSIWVIHYEETDFRFASSNVKLLHEGDVIPLNTTP